MYPSQAADKFVLRLPEGMRDRIKMQAAATRRTMNSLIIHALDRALVTEEAKGPAEAATSPSHGSSNPIQENAYEQAE